MNKRVAKKIIYNTDLSLGERMGRTIKPQRWSRFQILKAYVVWLRHLGMIVNSMEWLKMEAGKEGI
jgi:hypothetical protein